MRTSVTRLNDTTSDYLDEEEQQAQQMFPHYFQRFKTDGVEYNIYVGVAWQDKPFDLVFLKNLRLWQLLAMVEITRRTHALKAELPVPLDTTQLILIHSQPLSIRFRQDERQFDVDGAYNIRYEIIKKRIDKATVLGTGERLTQPGLAGPGVCPAPRGHRIPRIRRLPARPRPAGARRGGAGAGANCRARRACWRAAEVKVRLGPPRRFPTPIRQSRA
ncbi:MAG: hypothetical protein WKG07_42920 [Hymenobacter sp.]